MHTLTPLLIITMLRSVMTCHVKVDPRFTLTEENWRLGAFPSDVVLSIVARSDWRALKPTYTT